jgi:hypothetical protein
LQVRGQRHEPAPGPTAAPLVPFRESRCAHSSRTYPVCMGRGKKKGTKSVGRAVARTTLLEQPPARPLGELPLEVRLAIVGVFRRLAVEARRDAARAASRAAVRREELAADEALSGKQLDAVRLRLRGRLHFRRCGAHSTLCGKRVPSRLWRELQQQEAEAAIGSLPTEVADCRACLDSARSPAL